MSIDLDFGVKDDGSTAKAIEQQKQLEESAKKAAAALNQEAQALEKLKAFIPVNVQRGIPTGRGRDADALASLDLSISSKVHQAESDRIDREINAQLEAARQQEAQRIATGGVRSTVEQAFAKRSQQRDVAAAQQKQHAELAFAQLEDSLSATIANARKARVEAETSKRDREINAQFTEGLSAAQAERRQRDAERELAAAGEHPAIEGPLTERRDEEARQTKLFSDALGHAGQSLTGLNINLLRVAPAAAAVGAGLLGLKTRLDAINETQEARGKGAQSIVELQSRAARAGSQLGLSSRDVGGIVAGGGLLTSAQSVAAAEQLAEMNRRRPQGTKLTQSDIQSVLSAVRQTGRTDLIGDELASGVPVRTALGQAVSRVTGEPRFLNRPDEGIDFLRNRQGASGEAALQSFAASRDRLQTQEEARAFQQGLSRTIADDVRRADVLRGEQWSPNRVGEDVVLRGADLFGGDRRDQFAASRAPVEVQLSADAIRSLGGAISDAVNQSRRYAPRPGAKGE